MSSSDTRTLVEHGLVQVHERLRDRRPALHREDTVRDEAAGRLVVLEAVPKLRVGFPRQWVEVRHGAKVDWLRCNSLLHRASRNGVVAPPGWRQVRCCLERAHTHGLSQVGTDMGHAAPLKSFPQVDHHQASGELALVYEDIHATLRLPWVAFAIRVLAQFPHFVPAAWAALKPQISTRHAENAADLIRLAAIVPGRPPPDPRPKLSTLGWPPEQIANLNGVLDCVTPTGLPRPSFVVTTVTAVAKAPSALRKCAFWSRSLPTGAFVKGYRKAQRHCRAGACDVILPAYSPSAARWPPGSSAKCCRDADSRTLLAIGVFFALDRVLRDECVVQVERGDKGGLKERSHETQHPWRLLPRATAGAASWGPTGSTCSSLWSWRPSG